MIYQLFCTTHLLLSQSQLFFKYDVLYSTADVLDYLFN